MLFFCGFSAAFASTSSASSSSSSSSFSSSSHPYFHLLFHLILILIFIHITTIKNDNKSRTTTTTTTTTTTPGFRCFQDLPFPRSTHDQRHGRGLRWRFGGFRMYPSKRRGLLGGGFKYFLFSPLPGEMIQLDQYFSNGLKPPTRLLSS